MATATRRRGVISHLLQAADDRRVVESEEGAAPRRRPAKKAHRQPPIFRGQLRSSAASPQYLSPIRNLTLVNSAAPAPPRPLASRAPCEQPAPSVRWFPTGREAPERCALAARRLAVLPGGGRRRFEGTAGRVACRVRTHPTRCSNRFEHASPARDQETTREDVEKIGPRPPFARHVRCIAGRCRSIGPAVGGGFRPRHRFWYQELGLGCLGNAPACAERE